MGFADHITDSVEVLIKNELYTTKCFFFFVNFRCMLCYKIPSAKRDINFVKEDVKTELEDVSVILAAVLKMHMQIMFIAREKEKGIKRKASRNLMPILEEYTKRIHESQTCSGKGARV